MISDMMTTIKYYDYGVNPNQFKSNHTDSTYMHLYASSVTSTVEHSSYSNSFSYFYASCAYYAFVPVVYMSNISLWLLGFWIPGHDVFEMMEEKFGKIGLSATRIQKKSLCKKIIFLLLKFPIITLIAILWTYAISPMAMILIAFGNLFPKFGNKPLIKRLRNCGSFIKYIEAIFESACQFALAMDFYYYNKEDFDSQLPLIPWVTEGILFRITIHLSLFSIIMAANSFFHGWLTLWYGKDWWKLWKRTKVLCSILLFLLLVIPPELGLVIKVIHVVYL